MPVTKTYTGSVKITALPNDRWPAHVLRAWFGHTFPCEPEMQHSETRNRRLEVLVPQDKAIEILEKTSPAAAKFWKSQGLPKKGKYFAFGLGEVTILDKSVSYPKHRPKTVEVPAEALGRIDR